MLDGVLAEPGAEKGELKRLFDGSRVHLVQVQNLTPGLLIHLVRRTA